MLSALPLFCLGIWVASSYITPIGASSITFSEALPIRLYRARPGGRDCLNCTTTTIHRLNDTVRKNIQLEIIKRKILEGLGLTEVPERHVRLIPTPEPVIKPKPNVTETPTYGDIVSKSEPPDGIRDKSVLQFKVPDDPSDQNIAVHNGFLYVFVKKRGKTSKKNKRITLRISTVDERGKPKRLLSSLRMRLSSAKWQKIGLPSDLLQTVIENPTLPLRLHVRCKKCRKSVVPVLVFKSPRKRKRKTKDGKLRKQSRNKRRALNKKRPILVIHTKSTKSRSKRQTNVCNTESATRSQTNQTHCCKRSFYLNFTDIGWDDWIISPEGYVYSECAGGCPNRRTSSLFADALSEERSSSPIGGGRERRPRSRKQCKATRSLSLRVVYFDETLNVVRKRIPNMVVSSCGCRTVN